MAHQAATAAEKAPPVSPTPGKKLLVDTASVQVHHAGQCFTEFFATLSPGMSADALGDPGIWKPVQAGGNGLPGLRTLDRLTIVDFEMNWVVLAIVAAADDSGASLAITSKKDLPARNIVLPETENYRLAYSGRAFVILSKRSGLPAESGSYFSRSAAVNALYRMEPKVA